MSSDVITYKSNQLTVYSNQNSTDTATKDGVTCTWNGTISEVNYKNYMSWKFDWKSLVNIEGFSGRITVTSPGGLFAKAVINVDLNETGQEIKAEIPDTGYGSYNVIYEFTLTPHEKTNIVQEKVNFDEMFASSDLTDAILVIGEKKLHVNKAFLSIHSDYFKALFSSNFKEGQMNEIPIQDVSYEDFGLLMSSFYPNTVFPTDKTVEKLLDLADLFSITSVIKIVEYHLIHNSKIGNEKMMWMADRYVMKNLLQKTIRQLNTLEKAKKLKSSPEYLKLSDKTKGEVLDRLMNLI